MTTTENIQAAKIFPSHRALVEVIVALKDAGEISAYSIHAAPGGVSAGVCVDEEWSYLKDAPCAS